jgi:hypothetical protein
MKRLEDAHHRAGLVKKSFINVCRVEIARNEFSCTGIYRRNRNIFNVLAFLLFKLKDIPQPVRS